MKKFLLITTACVALSTTPAFASREQVAEVGPWWIAKTDGTNVEACFASITYQQSGMNFYIAQTRNPNNHDETTWDLGFRNKKWNLTMFTSRKKSSIL